MREHIRDCAIPRPEATTAATMAEYDKSCHLVRNPQVAVGRNASGFNAVGRLVPIDLVPLMAYRARSPSRQSVQADCLNRSMRSTRCGLCMIFFTTRRSNRA
jgi:hypothetical protein